MRRGGGEEQEVEGGSVPSHSDSLSNSISSFIASSRTRIFLAGLEKRISES